MDAGSMNLFQQIISRYQQGRLPHALLFSGVADVDKEVFLKKLSYYLLCENKKDSRCGQCHSCGLLDAGHHPDFLRIKPEDNKMIKVDEIRALSEFVNTSSQYHQAKIVLIHCADRMNMAASNALLKTLEEPAKNVYLFLLVEQSRFLPTTIRSRCQLYRMSAVLSMTSDEKKERHEFFNDCCELLRKRFSLVEISEKWHRKSLNTLLHHAFSWTMYLLKLKLVEGFEFVDQVDQADQETLRKLSRVCDINALFDCEKKLIECKKIISSQIAVNAQLMLEDMLLAWKRII